MYNIMGIACSIGRLDEGRGRGIHTFLKKNYRRSPIKYFNIFIFHYQDLYISASRIIYMYYMNSADRVFCAHYLYLTVKKKTFIFPKSILKFIVSVVK